jgi:chloramphenicol-sensitive protein RarD
VPPLEVLSHRTLWSTVFFLAVLAAQRRVGEAIGLLARPRAWAPLAASAALIAVNWLLFIAAVQQGRALEASLGYYVFPLLAVALGFLVLGERFTPRQSAAIGLAAVAVVVLSLGTGAAPWTALAIAGTFALYGLIKNQVRVRPVASVFVETLILAPLALAWLAWLHGGAFGQDWGTSGMLAFSGPLTGGPLMLCDGRAGAVPEPDAAVRRGGGALRRAVHRLARRGVRTDLGGARALLVGKLAAGVIGLRRFAPAVIRLESVWMVGPRRCL